MISMKPQKCLHMYLEEKKRIPKIVGDYIVSEKLDGWYCYVDFKHGVYSPIHSRAGRIIPAFEKHQEVFNGLSKCLFTHRFIMEAYIPGMDFHTMNGIFNRSVGDYHCKDVEFHVHDMIVLGEPSMSASERYRRLQGIRLFDEVPTIHVHPILGISPDKEIWMHYFNQVKEKGGEGIVLKHADSPYYPDKRNSSLMKIKLECPALLHCVAMYRTKGEKGNDNLNITLRSKDGNTVEVRVGLHSDIDKFESDKSSILDKVVEINSMCKLESGKYREPRFVKVREDKSLSDID